MRERLWRIFERYGELIGSACFIPFLLMALLRSLIKENWLAVIGLAALLGMVLFELPAMWRKAKQKWSATEEWSFREGLKNYGPVSVLFVLVVFSLPVYLLWLAFSALLY